MHTNNDTKYQMLHRILPCIPSRAWPYLHPNLKLFILMKNVIGRIKLLRYGLIFQDIMNDRSLMLPSIKIRVHVIDKFKVKVSAQLGWYIILMRPWFKLICDRDILECKL